MKNIIMTYGCGGSQVIRNVVAVETIGPFEYVQTMDTDRAVNHWYRLEDGRFIDERKTQEMINPYLDEQGV